MRTAIIICAGLVLWAVSLGLTKVFTQSNPAAFTRATLVFIMVWFAAAASNLWLGVHDAGYSWQEELLVFLVIFLLPSAVAVFVKWKYF